MSTMNEEALRMARQGSIARRPAAAIAGPVGGPSTGDRRNDGRTRFPNACIMAIGQIAPDPAQPRKTFAPESIAALAQSMRDRGQLVPILIRWSDDAGRYVIIDGERRYRAATAAGLAAMACVIEADANADTILEIQLVTNALREDVSPMEQAQAWRRLIEAKGYTHAELAARLGYDRSTVTRTVGLTEASPEIQLAIHAGEIRPQTGYELSRIANPDEQTRLLGEARAGRLRRDDVKGRDKLTASKTQGRGPKVRTSWTFRAGSGLTITAERTKGINPIALADALDRWSAEIRAGLGGEAGDCSRSGG